jgi:hypothetical protein
MRTLQQNLETECDAVAAKRTAVQDRLYRAGRDHRNQQEIERLRSEVPVSAASGRCAQQKDFNKK